MTKAKIDTSFVTKPDEKLHCMFKEIPLPPPHTWDHRLVQSNCVDENVLSSVFSP